MLGNVPVSEKSLAEYEILVDSGVFSDIKSLSGKLSGLRVLHINATAYGGGVAELLYTLVPLMRDVGLEVDWKVIQGAEDFYQVTKIMHNSLQGMDIPITEEMKVIFERYSKMNAELLQGPPYDIVIVHDPQPAAIPYFLPNMRAIGKKWIWRCHLDLTQLSRDLWHYLTPFLQKYDATVFTMASYVQGHEEALPPAYIIPPCIDPLSPKNAALDEGTVNRTLRKYHIDPERPLITQVSRYDPWKDPLGVIDAYRLVKEVVPEVQLLLAASMASDDPESWHYYEKTARHAGEDSDVYLLSNLQGVGNMEINAFQRGSDVVLQKSLREGFGLTVSEAMWKERPVIGGNVGGITIQIEDGKNGFLVDSVEACADKITYLYLHPEEAHIMGAAAKDNVREKFLSTTNLHAYLNLFTSLFANHNL